MPNHVHFILWLTDIVGAPLAGASDRQYAGGAGASPAPTLGDVVGAFKSIVATDWLGWVKRNVADRSARVWQRSYYERVIRNEDELRRVRQYILDNPAKWQLDRENPSRLSDATYEREWAWLQGAPAMQRAGKH